MTLFVLFVLLCPCVSFAQLGEVYEHPPAFTLPEEVRDSHQQHETPFGDDSASILNTDFKNREFETIPQIAEGKSQFSLPEKHQKYEKLLLPHSTAVENHQNKIGACSVQFICVHWQLCRNGSIVIDGSGQIDKDIKQPRATSSNLSCGEESVCCHVPLSECSPELALFYSKKTSENSPDSSLDEINESLPNKSGKDTSKFAHKLCPGCNPPGEHSGKSVEKQKSLGIGQNDLKTFENTEESSDDFLLSYLPPKLGVSPEVKLDINDFDGFDLPITDFNEGNVKINRSQEHISLEPPKNVNPNFRIPLTNVNKPLDDPIENIEHILGSYLPPVDDNLSNNSGKTSNTAKDLADHSFTGFDLPSTDSFENSLTVENKTKSNTFSNTFEGIDETNIHNSQFGIPTAEKSQNKEPENSQIPESKQPEIDQGIDRKKSDSTEQDTDGGVKKLINELPHKRPNKVAHKLFDEKYHISFDGNSPRSPDNEFPKSIDKLSPNAFDETSEKTSDEISQTLFDNIPPESSDKEYRIPSDKIYPKQPDEVFPKPSDKVVPKKSNKASSTSSDDGFRKPSDEVLPKPTNKLSPNSSGGDSPKQFKGVSPDPYDELPLKPSDKVSSKPFDEVSQESYDRKSLKPSDKVFPKHSDEISPQPPNEEDEDISLFISTKKDIKSNDNSKKPYDTKDNTKTKDLESVIPSVGGTKSSLPNSAVEENEKHGHHQSTYHDRKSNTPGVEKQTDTNAIGVKINHDSNPKLLEKGSNKHTPDHTNTIDLGVEQNEKLGSEKSKNTLLEDIPLVPTSITLHKNVQKSTKTSGDKEDDSTSHSNPIHSISSHNVIPEILTNSITNNEKSIVNQNTTQVPPMNNTKMMMMMMPMPMMNHQNNMMIGKMIMTTLIGTPLIGGSCSAGTFCVKTEECNPYNGFIVMNENQTLENIIKSDSPEFRVPLTPCEMSSSSGNQEGVCCQLPHPLTGPNGQIFD